jgi:hypothetical protein
MELLLGKQREHKNTPLQNELFRRTDDDTAVERIPVGAEERPGSWAPQIVP